MKLKSYQQLNDVVGKWQQFAVRLNFVISRLLHKILKLIQKGNIGYFLVFMQLI